MGALRQSGRGWSRRWTGAAVGTCLLLAPCIGLAAETSAWDAAVLARQVFEAKPQGTHSKADYAQVMDGFRAIYHGDPGDAHAARAVEQVAELLAEDGREFSDRKMLRAAAGQYEFLAKAYPVGRIGPEALGHALELLGPQASDDVAEAAKVRAQLIKEYPRSEQARAAKSEDSQSATATMTAAADHYVKPSRAIREDGAPAETPKAAKAMKNDAEATPAQEPLPGAEVVDAVADVTQEAHTPGKMALVTGIRHWSTPSYTRVAIDLGDAVEYQAARVEHPDRIFFDLHHARLAQQLTGKSFAITDDGFLTRIRAAQFSGDVTRVVLDVHQVAEYSAFLLPNPYRLIIDIHGKPKEQVERAKGQGTEGQPSAATEQGTEGALADGAAAAAPENPKSTAPKTEGVEVSSLPPMPVTDGSSGFGLPPRDGAATTVKEAVARPRVIIPARATASRPVPNAVVTRSPATGVEVAAVSDQPGKVEATRKPTSQPIVDRAANGEGVSKPSAAGSKGVRSRAHVAGEPAEPPPPTSDGEATLMRALGLKIGRIVIDAGHGGHDSGTLGAGGIEEKDVVLDVALRLGKLLHDRLGAEIVYTRADDTFVPLETRTAIANKAQADLFISVHANSSPDESARGVEVYYLNFTSDPEAMQVASRENAVSTQSVHELSDLVKKIALKDKIDESKELAEDVDQSLYGGLARGNEGLKNRGVKKAPFVVLIGANMPSILAEISFVTNPADAEHLRRPEYRERVAESLYKGVARYAQAINGGKKKPATTERAAR
jgi:N-acetylmuramoyl-L-alanine amidase